MREAASAPPIRRPAVLDPVQLLAEAIKRSGENVATVTLTGTGKTVRDIANRWKPANASGHADLPRAKR